MNTILSGLVGACLGLACMVQGAEAADKPFVIGAVLPQSGAVAQLGQYLVSAMNATVKELNEDGGILGRKVQILYRDSATDPQRSLLAAQELVEEQKVDFLFPELFGPDTLAILPYSSEQKAISMSNSSSPLTGDVKKYPYNFQLGDLSTERAPAVAAAMRKLGGHKVGIFVAQNPGTIATADQLEKVIPQYGMQVVARQVFSVDSKDLTAQLQLLRDAGADIISFDPAARDPIRVAMTGLQTLGWKVKVVTGNSALSGDLTEQVPGPVQDQFFATNYRAGTIVGPIRPEMQRFIKDMKTYGPIPNLSLSAVAHDIFYMVKWGYEKAAKDHGDAGADSVRAVYEAIGGSDYPASYSLVLGNPNWKPTDHTAAGVDYTKLWAIVHVSKPVDGMYEGEVLDTTR